MPFYDYQCEKGHRFEVRQSILDDALISCPKCGDSVHRVLYPAEILWRGDSKWEHRKGAVKIPEKDW